MRNYKLQFFFILMNVFVWTRSYAQDQRHKEETIKMDINYKPGVSTSLIYLNFKILDTANNHIFKLHPEIRYIAVSFIQDRPEVIWVRDNPDSRSYYDMSFKGDSLDILNKYGTIHFRAPEISLHQLIRNQKFNFPTHWEIGETIYKDSIVYSLGYSTGEQTEVVANGMAARLHGQYKDLAKQIADELQKKNISNLPDSIIVLQGIIEKGNDRSIEELKLIVGKQSAFSDTALQVIGNDQNKWHAATYFSGVTGASIIKFYIELRADGTVTILPSKYMDAKNL
ncbi:hypothetical protein [Sphingobacterium sp. UBA6320]|jgi:hypothetical protein|uniref:hypothetical protein n=1 Tax=Sphingobacterium sp. UBA6320 TaxID=1947510 RepID=UPI0025F4CCF4|nr:hypothetical protein [Sphingobacterium sp. UBA6320]